MEKKNKKESIQEPKVHKSFSVEYYTDGRIELKSTGEEELSTDDMYDNIGLLKDVIMIQRVKEAAKEGSFEGSRRVFAEMAALRMKQENEASITSKTEEPKDE